MISDCSCILYSVQYTPQGSGYCDQHNESYTHYPVVYSVHSPSVALHDGGGGVKRGPLLTEYVSEPTIEEG